MRRTRRRTTACLGSLRDQAARLASTSLQGCVATKRQTHAGLARGELGCDRLARVTVRPLGHAALASTRRLNVTLQNDCRYMETHGEAGLERRNDDGEVADSEEGRSTRNGSSDGDEGWPGARSSVHRASG